MAFKGDDGPGLRELAPRGERPQLAALTSLRFWAAFYVLAFHYAGTFFNVPAKSGIVSLGYTGVTFFFMLSGFILAYNYSLTNFTDRSKLFDYFISRFARIYPVYVLSLLVSLPYFLVDVLQAKSPVLKTVMTSAGAFSPLVLQAWVPGAVTGSVRH